MEAKKSNKIRDIVKLQQILKKWRKQANASKETNNNNSNGGGSKSIKFLKRTLSFTDSSTAVPKGYLAVSVGIEKKRYTIPTEYLSHQAFHVLLLEAEEEFGFQQAGVLRIPCEVSVFENILMVITTTSKEDCRFNVTDDTTSYRHPSNCPKTPSHQPHSPMCR